MRATERYDVCAAERLEGSKIAWLRPTRKLDANSSAVSAVVDVSSADSRQQCRSNGWQNKLEFGPTEPSGIRSAALRCQTRKSAECRAVQSKKSNEAALKAMRRTRARYGLHGAVEGMANNGAWPAAVSYLARTIFLQHRSFPHDSVENPNPSNMRLTGKVI